MSRTGEGKEELVPPVSGAASAPAEAASAPAEAGARARAGAGAASTNSGGAAGERKEDSGPAVASSAVERKVTARGNATLGQDLQERMRHSVKYCKSIENVLKELFDTNEVSVAIEASKSPFTIHEGDGMFRRSSTLLIHHLKIQVMRFSCRLPYCNDDANAVATCVRREISRISPIVGYTWQMTGGLRRQEVAYPVFHESEQSQDNHRDQNVLSLRLPTSQKEKDNTQEIIRNRRVNKRFLLIKLKMLARKGRASVKPDGPAVQIANILADQSTLFNSSYSGSVSVNSHVGESIFRNILMYV